VARCHARRHLATYTWQTASRWSAAPAGDGVGCRRRARRPSVRAGGHLCGPASVRIMSGLTGLAPARDSPRCTGDPPCAVGPPARCSPLEIGDYTPYGREARATTLPAGTYWVPMAQAQKHWVEAMLGEDSYVPFPYFYDVTAWSLPLIANVAGGRSGEPLAPKATVVAPQTEPAGPALPDDTPRRGCVADVGRLDGRRVLGLAALAAHRTLAGPLPRAGRQGHPRRRPRRRGGAARAGRQPARRGEVAVHAGGAGAARLAGRRRPAGGVGRRHRAVRQARADHRAAAGADVRRARVAAARRRGPPQPAVGGGGRRRVDVLRVRPCHGGHRPGVGTGALPGPQRCGLVRVRLRPGCGRAVAHGIGRGRDVRGRAGGAVRERAELPRLHRRHPAAAVERDAGRATPHRSGPAGLQRSTAQRSTAQRSQPSGSGRPGRPRGSASCRTR